MINFKALAAKYLREVADNIDSGNCDLTEKEAMDVLKIIAHEPLSKDVFNIDVTTEAGAAKVLCFDVSSGGQVTFKQSE